MSTEDMQPKPTCASCGIAGEPQALPGGTSQTEIPEGWTIISFSGMPVFHRLFCKVCGQIARVMLTGNVQRKSVMARGQVNGTETNQVRQSAQQETDRGR